MIVLSEAKESEVSKAYSTYPAIVVAVGQQTGSAMIKLWFFCPATMPGQPMDAVNPGGNNVVEAPRYPHVGAQEYNFQPGDVIIISYSDGNLNSPQFVRYVVIDDSVRNQNAQYVNGMAVTPEGYFNLTDSVTLSSDILQKAMSLRKELQLCAKGSTDNHEILYIISGKLNDNNVVLFKCGVFGDEFIALDVDGGNFASGIVPLTLQYNDGNQYTPDITFLEFCSYLFSGSTIYNIDYLSIIDDFKSACNKVGIDYKEVKDEKSALYLLESIAGFDDWSTGARTINATSYNENGTDKPEAETDYLDWSSYLDNLYVQIDPISSDILTYDFNLLQAFWEEFQKTYRRESERMYVIKLHNNIWRLRSRIADASEATNLLLLIFAVAATALQQLEPVIISGAYADDTGDFNKSLDFYTNLMRNGELTISDIEAQKITIATLLSNMYMYQLFDRHTFDNGSNEYNFKQRISSNIITMIDSVLSRADELIELFGSTITGDTGDIDTTDSITATDSYGNVWLWPVKRGYTNTSPYGSRWGSFHQGVDVGVPNGTQIRATRAGTVTVSQYDSYSETQGYGSYGYYVRIDHGNGYSSIYAHCQEGGLLVNVGDHVAQGQLIALSDNSGASTGPHLHFELRLNNSHFDPMTIFNYNDFSWS